MREVNWFKFKEGSVDLDEVVAWRIFGGRLFGGRIEVILKSGAFVGLEIEDDKSGHLVEQFLYEMRASPEQLACLRTIKKELETVHK